MKKIISIFLALILCFTIATPVFADSIILDFGDVAGEAGDVDVDTYTTASDLVMLRKILLGTTSPQSKKTTDVNKDGKIDIRDLVRLKKIMANKFENNIKLLGRSSIVYPADIKMYWSYTGVTFNAYVDGEVKATIDSSGVWAKYAKLAVIVDGDIENRKVIEIERKVVKEYILANVVPGVHTFEIVKVSEGPFGSMQLKGVDFTGYYTKKPAEADLTIEYVGDSITAGTCLFEEPYNENPSDYAHALAPQDVLESYSYKSARLLGADASIAAYSGINTADAPIRFFGNDSGYLESEPDITVIGLGTNDSGTSDDALSKNVTNMLKTVRQKYPNTKIVWVYGIMWKSKESAIKSAVESFNSTDGNTFYCDLPRNNDGGASHPSAEGHTAAAEVLAKYITETVLKK